jgi:hypothetical protein
MNIIRAVTEIAKMLLVITLTNKVVKLMIFPLCIFPLARDIKIHIAARAIKNVRWEGRYPLRLPGLVHITAKKDIVKITISAINVIILNLRISIDYFSPAGYLL